MRLGLNINTRSCSNERTPRQDWCFMEQCCRPGRCPADSEPIACRCLGVTEATVVGAIVALGLSSVREVREQTGAGDGCTCCHGRLRQLLREHAYSSSSAAPICSVK
jgi:bacterioferritin-associated ferredoxin